jgi:Uma2 family endonuclease
MAGLKLTLDEFLSQEETKPYREYACGEVYEKPMPNRSHSVIQRLLLVALTNFLEGRFLGEVFPELRCIFGPVGSERAYVPDLCFIRQARLAFDGFFYGVPDIAIEIVSPDHHLSRLLSKIQSYLLNGVELVWLIDPETQSISVHAPGQEVLVLGPADALDGGDVIPGFSVPVARVFGLEVRA